MTCAPAGSSSSTSVSSSTRTGASASMPSAASPRRDRVEQFGQFGVIGQQLAGALPDVLGEQQLAARRRPQPVRRDLERALVDDAEVPDLLDLVTPELHAQRVFLGRREDVEDAAAHREVAAALDQFGARVAGVHEVGDDVGQLAAAVAGAQHDRRELAEPRHLRLQHRADRRDHDRQRAGRGVVVGGVGEPAQHGETLADGVRAGREPLVRQRLPTGVERHPVRRQQTTERGDEVLGLTFGAGDGEDGAPGPRGSGDGERLGRGGGGDGELGGADVLGQRDEGGIGRGGSEQAGQRHGEPFGHDEQPRDLRRRGAFDLTQALRHPVGRPRRAACARTCPNRWAS